MLWNSKRRTETGWPPASFAPNSTPALGLEPAGPLYCWLTASAVAAVPREATTTTASTVRRIMQASLHRDGGPKTERAGFGPAMEFDPHTRLAGECLQP